MRRDLLTSVAAQESTLLQFAEALEEKQQTSSHASPVVSFLRELGRQDASKVGRSQQARSNEIHSQFTGKFAVCEEPSATA